MGYKRINQIYFMADTKDDLPNITGTLRMGAECFVIAESCEYKYTSKGEWVKQASAAGGGGASSDELLALKAENAHLVKLIAPAIKSVARETSINITKVDGSYRGTHTFDNIEFNVSGDWSGYEGLIGTFNDCTINGTLYLYGDAVFNNCEFNISGDKYNLWTWGAKNVTFNNCKFFSDGKAVLFYGDSNTTLILENCTFIDNGGLSDLKAAIEIGDDYGAVKTLIVNNSYVFGYEVNDKGINTGTTLWGNKNSLSQDQLNVIINGVDVY